jgi:hypothetical protein
MGMAFVVRIILPPVPEKIRWLFSEEEKEIAIRRSREAFNVPNSKLSPTHLVFVLRDPKVWYYSTYVSFCTMGNDDLRTPLSSIRVLYDEHQSRGI